VNVEIHESVFVFTLPVQIAAIRQTSRDTITPLGRLSNGHSSIGTRIMRKRNAVALTLVALSAIGVFLWFRSTRQTPAEPLGSRLERAAAPDAGAQNSLFTPAAMEEARREVSTDTAPESSERPTLAAAEGDATLLVHVKGKSTHKPIKAVQISVFDLADPGGSVGVDGTTGTIHTSPITGGDGSVEFSLPSGSDFKLWASPLNGDADHTDQAIPALAKGERRPLVVELEDGDDLHVRGVVLARDTRAAIQGATISVFRDPGYSGGAHSDVDSSLLVTTKTAADGTFELTTASWKGPFLRIEAGGFGPAQFVPRPSEQKDGPATVVLLERCAAIDAHVIDSAGAPLSGVVVSLSVEGYRLIPEELLAAEVRAPFPSEMKWSATTGPDGNCSLKALPPKLTLFVTLQRDGQNVGDQLESPWLNPGESRSITWRIGSGSVVSGVLVDENHDPVARHSIWLVQSGGSKPQNFHPGTESYIFAKASTDAEGRFAFSRVAAGRWLIGPGADGDDSLTPRAEAVAPYAKVIQVAEGSQNLELTLVTRRGLYIRGNVIDSLGKPVRFALVSVRTTGEVEDERQASTGIDGSFVAGPMMPALVQLFALRHGADAGSDTVTAKAGDTGVILKLRPGAIIAGKVVDGMCGLGCTARVTVAPVDLTVLGLDDTEETEADGSFQMKGIAPGHYSLIARTEDGRFAVLRDVVVSSEGLSGNLVMTVQPGGKLLIRFDCKSSSVYDFDVLCQGIVVARDMIDRDRPSIQLVPAGHLTIGPWMDGAGKIPKREITIAAGEEKEIVFTGDG
jgi:hypothetical protein